MLETNFDRQWRVCNISMGQKKAIEMETEPNEFILTLIDLRHTLQLITTTKYHRLKSCRILGKD